MSTQNLGLLNGIHSKMGFLNMRQQVYSQNVANADTPGFRPKDFKAPDFSRVMGKVGDDSKLSVSLASTSSGHLGTPNGTANLREVRAKEVYEASPDENGVILEEQIFKASKNAMDYQAMTNIYRRNVGMIRMAVVGNQ
jgi:flagellar basal-body rod protein FlgB